MAKNRKARNVRIERAKRTIRSLLKRGTAGNIGKLSGTTLDIAQAVAPATSVKSGEVKSGGKKRKTITAGAAKAEIRRRIFR